MSFHPRELLTLGGYCRIVLGCVHYVHSSGSFFLSKVMIKMPRHIIHTPGSLNLSEGLRAQGEGHGWPWISSQVHWTPTHTSWKRSPAFDQPLLLNPFNLLAIIAYRPSESISVDSLFIFHSPLMLLHPAFIYRSFGEVETLVARNGDYPVWRTKAYSALIDMWSLAKSFLRHTYEIRPESSLWDSYLEHCCCWMLEQVKQALKQAESSVSFTNSPFLSSHDLSSNQFYGVLLFCPSFCSPGW